MGKGPLRRWAKRGLTRLNVANPQKEEQRELERLARLPRFIPGDARLLGGLVRYVDSSSLVSAYRTIFMDEIYSFKSARPDPYIIDGGANVGLATLFWSRAFPSARIQAFEPDPGSFQALTVNAGRFRLTKVQLHQRALWTTTGTNTFDVQGADAGRVSPKGRLQITSVRLAETLDRPVDMLKLDIEGAEVDVLVDSAEELGHVRRLFVEYHGFQDQTQKLGLMLELLTSRGFRYWIHGEFAPPHPLLEASIDHDMDLRVNVFAVRQET